MAVAGYNLRIDSGSPINVGNTLMAHLEGLSPATDYFIEVQAYDFVGNFGPWRSVILTTWGVNFVTRAGEVVTMLGVPVTH